MKNYLKQNFVFNYMTDHLLKSTPNFPLLSQLVIVKKKHKSYFYIYIYIYIKIYLTVCTWLDFF